MSDPATTPTEPTTPAEPNSQPNGDATGPETGKGGEKLFTQAELDAKIDERLRRAKEKADADAKKAADKAAADALKEQGEYKTLSETQAKQLLDLTTEKDKLTTERDDLQAKAAKYETALNKLLDTYKAAVPEHVKPLLDRLDPVEQLNWISENQDKVKTSGVPMTPKADGRGLTQAQQEAARKQSDRFYRDGF